MGAHPDDPNPDRWASWRPALALATVGIVLVACTGVGAFLGLWLDGEFGTKPWLMVTGIILGTLAGFIEMYRAAKRFIT